MEPPRASRASAPRRRATGMRKAGAGGNPDVRPRRRAGSSEAREKPDVSDAQPVRRERTIHWEDPMATPREAARRGWRGIEFLRAIRDGELPPPPIAELMGMTLSTVEEG